MKKFIAIALSLVVSVSLFAQEQEIIVISADNSTVVTGEKHDTWKHEPLLTIINIKEGQVYMQDMITRKYASFKIIDTAYRNNGEIGYLLEDSQGHGRFIGINTVTMQMEIHNNKESHIIQKDIKIE